MSIPFSFGWEIDSNKGYFVMAEKNLLLEADFSSKSYRSIKFIGDNMENPYRRNPICKIINNQIFCFPDMGDCIEIINNKTKKNKIINLLCNNKKRHYIKTLWTEENYLFFLDSAKGSIVKIDVDMESIVGEKRIVDEDIELGLSDSILVGDEIYIGLRDRNTILSYNLSNGKKEKYTIPGLATGIGTLCYDGDFFWITGYRKELYVWNKEKNETRIICDFPEGFGYYKKFGGDGRGSLDTESQFFPEPIFSKVIYLNGSIWFIPVRMNHIIRVSKEKGNICIVDIEKPDIIKKKYTVVDEFVFQYIRDARFLGIYSMDYEEIIEIDTNDNSIKKLQFIPEKGFERSVTAAEIEWCLGMTDAL